jgi:glycerol-3-phosphate acyltransferase PlsY
LTDVLASLPTLLTAIVASYVLGALPLAEQVSRRNGVDIFSVGTGLAGATNVRRSVGRGPGLLVFIGDLGKGALAILLARILGVEGVFVLLPATAAVIGHWSSVFSGFRGGDGLATLGGVLLALFGMFGALAIAAAMVVALGAQRMPFSSLLSIVFGYATLVALIVAYDGDTILAIGDGGMSGLVLARALLGHKRRRGEPEWEGLEDPQGSAVESSGS